MSSPDLTDEDRQAVIAVIHTHNLSMGQHMLSFERAFFEQPGRRHAIGVNSGIAGLRLCVRAAGIGAGDLVIPTLCSGVMTEEQVGYVCKTIREVVRTA